MNIDFLNTFGLHFDSNSSEKIASDDLVEKSKDLLVKLASVLNEPEISSNNELTFEEQMILKTVISDGQ